MNEREHRLEDALRREARSLAERIEPEGRVAAAVRAALDAHPARERRAPFAFAGGAVLAAAAAALLLFVLVPRRNAPPVAPAAEGVTPAIAERDAGTLLVGSLERLAPAALVRAVADPVSELANEEAERVLDDLGRVARGLSERMPAGYGAGLVRELERGRERARAEEPERSTSESRAADPITR